MAERVPDFGIKMRLAREARGLSLREIANATKIAESALESLERNDISRLPGGIFSRAFVRSYAEEIGLDAEEAVRDFLAQFPDDSVSAWSPDVAQEDFVEFEASQLSAQAALTLVCISLPIVGGILYFTMVRGAEAPPAQEPAAVFESAPVDVLPAPFTGEPLTFEVLALAPVSLDLEVDGRRHAMHVVAEGERVTVQAEREMIMTMSDAGAVELTIDGQSTVALGLTGESRTVQIGRSNYGAFLASQ
jgi:transcriptional regulator with XRE-family HTH domain